MRRREERGTTRRRRRSCRLLGASQSGSVIFPSGHPFPLGPAPLWSLESEHTSWHSVHFVLDKEVYEGDDAAIERARHVFPVLDRSRVGRAKGDAPEGPGYGRQQVGDHEDIVPVMVVGGGDIGPAAASECSEDAPEGDEGRQLVARPARKEVPEGDESESRTCRNKSVLEVPRIFWRQMGVHAPGIPRELTRG